MSTLIKLSLLASLGCLTACQSNPVSVVASAPSSSLHTQRSPAEEKSRAILLQAIQLYNQKDYAHAKPLFEQAMDSGDFKAPRYLGLMALNGLGEPKNEKSAFDYFTQSAEKGDITSQYWLAYCYENGVGTNKNLTQALHWYSVSAQRGDIISAPAIMALGRWYETGLIGNPDRTQAIVGYQKASQVGDIEANQALKRLMATN